MPKYQIGYSSKGQGARKKIREELKANKVKFLRERKHVPVDEIECSSDEATKIRKRKNVEFVEIIQIDTTLDGNSVTPDLIEAIPKIKADQVHNLGITGAGIGVAVLDTGAKANHGDLQGRIVTGYNFAESNNDWSDCQSHGTHTAGTVALVAPGCHLFILKVFPACQGSTSSSKVVEAIEWCIAWNENPQVPGKLVHAISMSLSGGSNPEGPYSLAVTAAKEANINILASAGNSGHRYSSVGAPAICRGALAISATKRSLPAMAAFTSIGPEFYDFGRGLEDLLKPSFAAPGEAICAASIGSGTCNSNPPRVQKSGTSMSCPMAAGVVALARQKFPNKTANEIDEVVMWTANFLAGEEYIEQGTGEVDALAAVTMGESIPPQSLEILPSAVEMAASGNEDQVYTGTFQIRNLLDTPYTCSPVIESPFSVQIPDFIVEPGATIEKDITVTASLPMPEGMHVSRLFLGPREWVTFQLLVDESPPVVTITDPDEGFVYPTQLVPYRMTLSDNVGIDKLYVQDNIDSNRVYGYGGRTSARFVFDYTRTPGNHIATIWADDLAGNESEKQVINFTVLDPNLPPPPPDPPPDPNPVMVKILTPEENETLDRNVWHKATLEVSGPVRSARIWVDGTHYDTSTSAPFDLDFQVKGKPNAEKRLQVTVTGDVGQTGTDTVIVISSKPGKNK